MGVLRTLKAVVSEARLHHVELLGIGIGAEGVRVGIFAVPEYRSADVHGVGF